MIESLLLKTQLMYFMILSYLSIQHVKFIFNVLISIYNSMNNFNYQNVAIAGIEAAGTGVLSGAAFWAIQRLLLENTRYTIKDAVFHGLLVGGIAAGTNLSLVAAQTTVNKVIGV
jgi:hypothetical protein